MAEVTMNKVMVAFPHATSTEWESFNPVIPTGTMVFTTDTNEVRVGDGATPYMGLEPAVKDTLTAEQKALVDNAGAANGIVVLDENGQIDFSQFPNKSYATVSYIDTFTQLDAIPVEDRKGIMYFVLDASDAPDTESGAAMYAWQNPPGLPDVDEWVKIAEYESLDIDTSVLLKKTDMLDAIPDGLAYVKVSPELKAILDSCEEGATHTSNAHVMAAGALMFFEEVPDEPV